MRDFNGKCSELKDDWPVSVLQVNLENQDTVKMDVMENGVHLVPRVSRAFLDLLVQPDHPVTAILRPVIWAQVLPTSPSKTLAWRDQAETKNLTVWDIQRDSVTALWRAQNVIAFADSFTAVMPKTLYQLPVYRKWQHFLIQTNELFFLPTSSYLLVQMNFHRTYCPSNVLLKAISCRL